MLLRKTSHGDYISRIAGCPGLFDLEFPNCVDYPTVPISQRSSIVEPAGLQQLPYKFAASYLPGVKILVPSGQIVEPSDQVGRPDRIVVGNTFQEDAVPAFIWSSQASYYFAVTLS